MYNNIKQLIKELSSIQTQMKSLRTPSNYNIKLYKSLYTHHKSCFEKLYNKNISDEYKEYRSDYYNFSDITYKVLEIKELLRYMYIAYGLLRGKSISQIEKPKEKNIIYEDNWNVTAILSYFKTILIIDENKTIDAV